MIQETRLFSCKEGKMFRIFKLGLWVLALAVFAVTVTACGAPATQAPPPNAAPQTTFAPNPTAVPAAKLAPVKLKVWVEMSDNPKLFQDAFAQYAKDNNVEVEVVCPAPMDKILAALSGSDSPDIVAMSTSTLAQSLAFQGLTLDLKEIGTMGGIDFNDTYPSSLTQCQQGSNYACLPWGTDTTALFWNKDLFEAAGLDPNKPPKTLEELDQFAAKLNKKDAKGNYTQMGFIPDFPWSQQGTVNYLFGGSNYADGGRTLTVNSQANIESYKWAQSYYTKYGAKQVTDFKSSFGDYASSENGFFAQKVAMMIDGEWVVGPNFIPKFSPALNYGVAPIPVAATKMDMYGSATVGGTIVVVPAATKDKQATAKLLAWMESPQVVADIMYQMANLPSSKKAAQDARFKTIKNFQVFIDIMANPKSNGLLNSPVNQELNDAITKAEEKIWQEGADPATLLNEIQKEFEPKLQEAWGQVK
jgi:multiple sugar transport system substrate-binding protein